MRYELSKGKSWPFIPHISNFLNIFDDQLYQMLFKSIDLDNQLLKLNPMKMLRKQEIYTFARQKFNGCALAYVAYFDALFTFNYCKKIY